MNNVLGTQINTMKRFLLPKDVAKQLRDAEKAADEAARDRLDAERKAAKQRRADLIAEWGLPEKPPTRIGRPSYQQIWDMGLWQMLDEVVNGKIQQPDIRTCISPPMLSRAWGGIAGARFPPLPLSLCVGALVSVEVQ